LNKFEVGGLLHLSTVLINKAKNKKPQGLFTPLRFMSLRSYQIRILAAALATPLL